MSECGGHAPELGHRIPPVRFQHVVRALSKYLSCAQLDWDSPAKLLQTGILRIPGAITGNALPADVRRLLYTTNAIEVLTPSCAAPSAPELSNNDQTALAAL